MRNLQLIDYSLVSDASLTGCTLITVDCDVKLVYGVTNTHVVALDPFTKKITNTLSLVDNASYNASPVCIQYLFDRMAVFVAMSNGDIFLWNTTSNEADCVGSLENGISCAAWSPDMEVLAIYTGNEQLVLMSRDLDMLSEVTATPEQSGEAQMITVGWGKKETQFHGSQGKNAALSNNKTSGLSLKQDDDNKPRISWRGDGQYFVVSCVNSNTGLRELRVWTREGVLHSLCDTVDGIGQSACYRPSGSVITSTVVKDTSHSTIFFEKNGLRKENIDFKLPLSDKKNVKVNEVLWNSDSNILALWTEELFTENDAVRVRHHIELWTMSNYHWYMKQIIHVDDSHGRLNAMVWDPTNTLSLHLIFNSGYYANYTWKWTTDHSLGQTSDDLATVAVIDSDRVLMTPFRTMVVPPPLSAFHLQLPSPIHCLAFCLSPSHSNDIAIVLDNNSLIVYKHVIGNLDETVVLTAAGGTGYKPQCSLPSLHSVFKLEGDDPCIITHLLWTSENELIYCKSDQMQTVIRRAQINWTSASLTIVSSVVVPEDMAVTSVVHNVGTRNTVLQMSDGRLLKLDDSGPGSLVVWKVSNGNELRMPVVCQQLALCVMNDQEVVLGLSEKFRFYVDCIEVANNCTSFAVHDEFLLLTTHSHICQCISRKTSPADISKVMSSSNDETVRHIERGARIVCAVPSDTKVVLQMPRGNLEVIHPRSLVLSAVRRNLDRIQFHEAFQLMKKHRINMNLLYDHNPLTYLANTDTCVEQLNLPININLFLTDLQKEDVTDTLYTQVYKNDVRQTVSTNKIDTVCDAVEKAMERINPDKYVLSILTAYAKKSKPQLELALQRIQALKGSSGSVVTSDEALRHLLYLVDVNELYNVALGTYDFTLVLMVAEKSQKDPKEYLAQLNELQKMDVNYQRYSIDVLLKRFDSALKHLIQCGQAHFNESLLFIKNNHLYVQALNIYQVNTAEYLEVSTLFGDYLSDHQRYEEAGLILYRVGQLERALVCFEACLDWKLAMITACQLDLPNIQQLSRQLANKLVEVRRYTDAACLMEQYSDDFEEAIVILINGGQWQEALRLIHKYKRPDLIETNLKPAIIQGCDQQITMINKAMSDFEKFYNRLKIVREERLQKLGDLYDGAGDGNVNNVELYSDTSSVTDDDASSIRSLASRRSKASSSQSNKSRQKRERKRWSLKEGSPHEHLALVSELQKLVMQADQWKGEVASLVSTLVLFNCDCQASQLQSSLGAFLDLIDQCYSVIWQPASTSNECNSLGPNSTVNSVLKDRQRTDNKLTHETNNAMSSHLVAPLRQDVKWKLTIDFQ